MTVRSQDIYGQSTQNKPSKPTDNYERGGLAAAHLTAITLYAVGWLLNGATTVVPIVLLCVRIALFFSQSISPLWFVIGICVGIIVHIAISIIEHHLWRSGDRRTYVLVIAVGIFDVLSAAISLLVFGMLFGLDILNPLAYFIVTALAMIIAIVPEPMIVLHLRLYRKGG